MQSAWIAVIGTLSGVAITAGASLFAAGMSARHQRELSAQDRLRIIDDRSRAERRQAFVDYLAAYSDLRDRLIVLVETQISTSEGSADTRPAIQKIEEFAPEESARFSRTYHTLRITGGTRTCEAAHACTSQLWDLAELATSGKPELFWTEAKAGQPLRRALRAEMRTELGVPD